MVAPIPQTDKDFLKALGFDVGEYICTGAYGHVFKGVCNENAAKAYEITKEEWDLHPPRNKWMKGNKYLLERSLTTRECAIKRLKNIPGVETMLTEVAVLMELSHPNIVEVYNAIKADQNQYIIMEYINGNDLKQRIETYRNSGQRFTPLEVNTMFTELVEGLRYLHRNGVMHGDIQTGNIMLHLRNPPVLGKRQIKYIDFGLSRNSVTGMGFTPTLDIQKLVHVFNHILRVSNLETEYLLIYKDLILIFDRMWKNRYQTVERLHPDLYPILDTILLNPSPPPHSSNVHNLVRL